MLKETCCVCGDSATERAPQYSGWEAGLPLCGRCYDERFYAVGDADAAPGHYEKNMDNLRVADPPHPRRFTRGLHPGVASATLIQWSGGVMSAEEEMR